jgi:hypothetical protein
MVIINFLSLLLTTDVSGKGAHDEHLFLKEDQKKLPPLCIASPQQFEPH